MCVCAHLHTNSHTHSQSVQSRAGGAEVGWCQTPSAAPSSPTCQSVCDLHLPSTVSLMCSVHSTSLPLSPWRVIPLLYCSSTCPHLSSSPSLPAASVVPYNVANDCSSFYFLLLMPRFSCECSPTVLPHPLSLQQRLSFSVLLLTINLLFPPKPQAGE